MGSTQTMCFECVTDLDSFPKLRGSVSFNEPMSRHTSFRIGGPADVFVEPADVSDVQAVVRWANEHSVALFVLGAGTNLLVSDRGIRGIVVRLGSTFNKISIRGAIVRAGGAVRLPRLVRKALGSSLRGLEGLVGIPGTVGGAICMNAGTNLGCVEHVLESVIAVDQAGEVQECLVNDLDLGYRTSMVCSKGLIIIEAVFRLIPDSPLVISNLVSEIMSKRRRTQPAVGGTAGSVFKNPPGEYAGRLLEKVGAKGMQVGGARVSSKHANFIQNTGCATAEDVWLLMNRLRKMVMDSFGVQLEPEIRLVGEWPGIE